MSKYGVITYDDDTWNEIHTFYDKEKAENYFNSCYGTNIELVEIILISEK